MVTISDIRFRRNTPAGAAASNPVLDDGEPGWDGQSFKIGNGVTAWNDLPILASISSSSLDLEADEIYADWAALLADQNSQLDGDFYYVQNAAGHPGINSGGALLLYLGTIVGDESDYAIMGRQTDEKNTAAEIEALLDAYYGNTDWRTGGPGGGANSYTLANTYTTAGTTFDGTQKGAFNLYAFNKVDAQTVLIDAADYAEGETINLMRIGEGSVEILAPSGETHGGVRDINNRFYLPYPGTIVTGIKVNSKIYWQGCTNGFSGRITITSYGELYENETRNVPVSGTGFSSNMKTPVASGLAGVVINSFNFVDNQNITLNITTPAASGGQSFDITYDNGSEFTDTAAITIGAVVPPELVITTNSTSAAWQPSNIVKTGAVLKWTVTGGSSGVYDSNSPSIDLSANTGTATITVTSTDDLAGWTAVRFSLLNILTIDVTDATALQDLWITSNADLNTVTGLNNLTALTNLDFFSNTNYSGELNVSGLSNLSGTERWYNNNISSLNVTGCSGITQIQAYGNNISSITGLTDCTACTTMWFHLGNNLSSIDITGLTSLQKLRVDTNTNLTTITGFATCTGLTEIDAAGTQISLLDTSAAASLKTVDINDCDSLPVSQINQIILDQDAKGLSNGNLDWRNVTNPPTRTQNTTDDVLTAYNNLVARSYNLNSSPAPA